MGEEYGTLSYTAYNEPIMTNDAVIAFNPIELLRENPKLVTVESIKEQENMKENIEKRTYLNFKVGDLVKIRSHEDMVEQYGDVWGDIHFPYRSTIFPSAMKKYCGKEYLITKIKKNNVYTVVPFGHKMSVSMFRILQEMIEIVEENYVEKHKGSIKMNKTNEVEYKNEEIIKEMISKVDRQKLLRIFAGSFNMNQKDIVGLDKLLEEWAKAKAELYVTLGNNLKIEKEIETDMSIIELKSMFNDIVNKFPVFKSVVHDLYEKSIRENIYNGDFSRYQQYCPELVPGMKLTKALSLIMNNPEFDIELSKVYEKQKVKGTIALSIDPVDYVLMSVNKSGWNSCHTLHNFDESDKISFGCYSAGTLSYMCDSATLIAYRHSDKIYEYKINKVKFKEYSKNWREVFYYDNKSHAFIASRQYPYYDENLSKCVRNMFEELLSQKFEFKNIWSVNKKSDDFGNYIKDDGLHYNDMLNGYDGVICFPKGIPMYETEFEVGSYPVCPICGERKLGDEHYPCCWSCYDDVIDY